MPIPASTTHQGCTCPSPPPLNLSPQDRYLLAAGFTNPHLLPPPEGLYPSSTSSAASTSGHQQHEGTQHEGPSLVTKLVGAVAGALERAGNALAALGGWLRRSLAGVPLFGAGAEAEPEGGSGQGGEGAPPKRVNQVGVP